jgi:uncharacterized protein (TIGR02996 family)
MPNTEQLALRAAIRADPDDDTPRLVYADWLQENGDPDRAEFIRLQCAVAKLPDDRQTRRKVLPAMEHRERVLLTANGERWFQPVLRLYRRNQFPEVRGRRIWSADFRRGFIWGLRIDLDDAYRLTTASPALEPMGGLTIFESDRLVGNTKKLAAVVAWEDAACFHSVSLRYASDEDVYLIVRGRLSRLAELGLHDGSVTNVGAGELAGWAGGTNLLALNLSANRIGDAGAEALAESPHLAELQRLDLRRNPVTGIGVRRLIGRFGASVLLPHD